MSTAVFLTRQLASSIALSNRGIYVLSLLPFMLSTASLLVSTLLSLIRFINSCTVFLYQSHRFLQHDLLFRRKEVVDIEQYDDHPVFFSEAGEIFRPEPLEKGGRRCHFFGGQRH